MMFGTDWNLVGGQKGFRAYPKRIAAAYARFGEAVVAELAGGHALRFLGIADGMNRTRLRKYYEEDLRVEVPSWLA